LPSDIYLCLTGYASSIIAGERSVPTTMPDFAAMSQPSIPEVIFPKHLDTINSGQAFSSLWTPSVHKTDITAYQLKVDNQIYNLGKITTSSITLTPGWHKISVRAKNGLGNYGGWSEVNDVYARVASTTSVSEQSFSDGSFHVFPNPAKTSFYLTAQVDIREKATINLLSQDGKLLHTDKISFSGLTEINIPASAYTSSFIYLQIQAGEKQLLKKLIIVH
jgi:hypothetical protein